MLPIFSLGAPSAAVLSWIEFSTQTHVAHTSLSPSVSTIPLCRFLSVTLPLACSFSLSLSHSHSRSLFPPRPISCLFSYPGWPLLFRYSLCLPRFVYFHGSMRLARFTYGRYFFFRNTLALCRIQQKGHQDRANTVQRSVSRGTRASRKNTEEVTAASAGTGHPC